MDSVIFEGQLQEIRLKSPGNAFHGILYFPACRGKEREQHLTINANGKVHIERYKAGFNHEDELFEKSEFSISSKDTKAIMRAFTARFKNGYTKNVLLDITPWLLTLTNTAGEKFEIHGVLEANKEVVGLSELIREKLKRDDLIVFDGNVNSLSKVVIEYESVNKEEKYASPYNESLTIDCKSRIIKYVRKRGNGWKIKNVYHMPMQAEPFFDPIFMNDFYKIEGDPIDAIEDKEVARKYTITLYARHGEVKTLTGAFDKRGLPSYWPIFIKKVHELIDVGYGEIFNEDIYGGEKPKVRDYLRDHVCYNVVFKEGGDTYCYLAGKDDKYQVGDLVVVPVGPDNEERVVRIKSIEQYPGYERLFPMYEMKFIIRKYEEKEEKKDRGIGDRDSL